jgi:hypothetical protein
LASNSVKATQYGLKKDASLPEGYLPLKDTNDTGPHFALVNEKHVSLKFYLYTFLLKAACA